jgi:hypothetical protein
MSRAKGGREPILTAEMVLAASDLDLYWHAVHDETGVVSSYGNQRWSGTPMSQVSQERLLGPEWRETCRQRLGKAEFAIGDARLWQAMCHVVEIDGTAEDAGHKLGYASPSAARAAGVTAMQLGLRRLSVFWGYAS